jgi:hypothetical protein
MFMGGADDNLIEPSLAAYAVGPVRMRRAHHNAGDKHKRLRARAVAYAGKPDLHGQAFK